MTLHMRIFCPGPDTVAPGYSGVRVDWTDLKNAEWELNLDGTNKIDEADLTSLGNGYYVAQRSLSDVPLGLYEVKLRIEDNAGNKLEYKEGDGSFITVFRPSGAPSEEPSGRPTESFEPSSQVSEASSSLTATRRSFNQSPNPICNSDHHSRFFPLLLALADPINEYRSEHQAFDATNSEGIEQSFSIAGRTGFVTSERAAFLAPSD